MNVSKEKLDEIQQDRRNKIIKVIKEIGFYNADEDYYQISISNISEITGIARSTVSQDLQALRDDHKITIFPRKIIFGVRIENEKRNHRP